MTLGASVADVLSISTQAISGVDAGADAIVGWDDSAGKLTFLAAADIRTILNVEDGILAEQYTGLIGLGDVTRLLRNRFDEAVVSIDEIVDGRL